MCKSSALRQHVGADTAPSNDIGSEGVDVSTLQKERQEKIESSAKFYWANDEEPHRRRSVIIMLRNNTKLIYLCYFVIPDYLSPSSLYATQEARNTTKTSQSQKIYGH